MKSNALSDSDDDLVVTKHVNSILDSDEEDELVRARSKPGSKGTRDKRVVVDDEDDDVDDADNAKPKKAKRPLPRKSVGSGKTAKRRAVQDEV